MRKSANCFDLISMACDRVSGKFLKAFVGTLCFIAPLAVLVMVPAIIGIYFSQYYICAIGICLAIVLFGPMEIGYIKYMRKVFLGEKVSVKEVFSHFNKFPTLCFLTVVMVLLYVFGFVLIIFPLLFVIMFYSMAYFVIEKYEIKSVKETLTTSRRLIARNRTSMFAYKVLFYIFYLLMVGFAIISIYWTVVNQSYAIVSILMSLINIALFILLYSIITIFYHSCNSILFEEAVERKAKEIGLIAFAVTKEDIQNVDDVVSNNNIKEKSDKKSEEDINKKDNTENKDKLKK